MANIRNVNLNLLLVFDALMQEAHLSRAGDKMGLSQPGMSYSLKQLRELFDDPLFVKSRAGMEPTDKALAVYPLIHSALSKVNEAVEYDEIFDPKSSELEFKLGLCDYASYILLPNLFGHINQCAPHISLSIQNLSTPEKSRLLDDDDIDLAIGVYDTRPKRLQSVELFKEKIVCIFDPGIIKVSNKVTIRQFTKHPHLLIDFREDPPLTIQQVLAKHGLSRRVAITIPHVVTAGRLIKGTDLLAAVPLRIAKVLADQYALAIADLPVKIQDYGVYLVWHKRNNDRAEQVWIREIIKSVEL